MKGDYLMDTNDVTLKVLPDYRLKIDFPNGSEAKIDMSKRVQGIRFGILSSEDLFATAHVEADNVIWNNGVQYLKASITELLDSMQME